MMHYRIIDVDTNYPVRQARCSTAAYALHHLYRYIARMPGRDFRVENMRMEPVPASELRRRATT